MKPTTTPESPPPPPTTGKASLWIAAVGTPALFAIQLTFFYTLLPVLCRQQRVWVFHVITGVFLVLAAVALGVAAREWSRLASRKPSSGDDVEALGRAQFLAVAGTMVATLFFSVILASGIPPFFVDPCQD